MILKNKIALLSFLTLLSFTQSAHSKPVVAEEIKDISQNVFQETLKESLPDSIANQKKEQLEALKASAKAIGLKEKSDEETMLWGILGDQLLTALTAYENGDSDWAKEAHIPHDRVIEDRLILTAFDYDYSGQKRDFPSLLSEHGAKVTPNFDPRAVEIEIPISHLRELSQYVAGLEITGYTDTTAKTAGWIGTNANWWQLTGRVTGNGRGGDGNPVTIAIVDQFDERLFPDLISRGLIPPGTSITRNLDPTHYNEHGNRILQLIYEIAPEARFLLINTNDSSLALIEGINTALTLNPDIINTSLSNLIDRRVGRNAFPGPAQAQHQKAIDQNTLIVSSAGNYGALGMHWSGLFIPSTRYPQLLNWNTQTATTFISDAVTPANIDLAETSNVSGEVIVNDLGCLEPAASSDYPIRIDAGLSPQDSIDYTLTLVKYIPGERGWRALVSDNGMGIYYSKRIIVYENSKTETPHGDLIQADIPSSNCSVSQDRYGIVIEKNGSSSTSHDPTYINLFTIYDTLKIYNTSVSLSESNTFPESVNVAAALCIAPLDSGCSVQGPSSTSSRGPALTFGMQPNELNRNFLTLQSHSDLNSDAVKPDFISPSPSLREIPGITYGTSGAAAVTSGMTALLLDRYPQFRRNPSELKAALMRLAERSIGLQSTYARYSEDPNNPRYGEVRASYKYGRGYLKLEKENTIYMRGRPNHVRLNQNMTSSPRTARTVNGTETFLPASEYPPSNMSLIPRYADGLGPQPVFYLTGETGGVRVGASTPDTIDTGVPTRMLYPVLKPVIVFDPASFGGTAAARGAMFMGGTTSTQLFPSNSRLSSSYLDTLKTAGYFSFPSLQFTANPTASPMIGQMYSLTMRAARRDGTIVPTDSTQAGQSYATALSAAQARQMRDGTPIDYLSLGCPTCFVRQNTTATFNTCQAGYRPSLADTCPTTP